MPVVSHRLIERIPASSCSRRHHIRILAAGISPSNGQPKLQESDTATRIPAVAARAAASLMAWNESSPDMRRVARLWLSLADYVFDVAIIFVILLAIFKREVPRFSLSLFSRTTAVELLKESWPYILSGLLVTIYMRIDMIMIKELMSDASVGEYAAAVRISEAWYFIPVIIVGSLYPAIVNAKKLSEKLYLERLSSLYCLMFYMAVAVSIASSLLSGMFVQALFGSAFSQASNVLMIHVWASIFVFVGVASDKWLLTEGLQIYSAINALLGAALNVALNLVLIPRIGIIGAAWATLISYAFSGYVCLAIWPKTRRNFRAVTVSIFRLPRFA